MENWPIYLVSALVHFLMFLSVGYGVVSCQIRTLPEKFSLLLLAFFIPIFGPIIAHNRLNKYIKYRGQWIDVNGGSYFESSGSKEGSTSSDSGCDSGGSGD